MFLGLDLGTTNVKAIVVDRTGQVLARASAPVGTHSIGPDGVEQDLEEIWSAARSVLVEAARTFPAGGIRALGVSSQGGALQVLNQAGKPVGRVVSWLDMRGRDYDAKLNAELGKDWFGEHTGHHGSALTIGQLLHLRQEGRLPDNFHLGFVGDQIVKRLCGLAAHDATSLSLAMLYNPRLGNADPDLLARMGLSEDRLPSLLSPRQAAGGLNASVARATSLPEGIPVSPAIHDQYSAALAAGATNPGDVMVGTGTAWVLLAVSDKLPRAAGDDAFVCTHVVPEAYGQILPLRNGGSALAWAARLVGMDGADCDRIDQMAQTAPPGSEGLVFWPFLAASGEAVANGTAGRLVGLRLSHTAAHLLRAVIEGLACELARYLRLLLETRVPAKRLVLCGGAARSRLTPQILANVVGLPVECLTETDTSAFGAAVIARGLAEPGADLAELARQMRPSARLVKPGHDRPRYAKLFEAYLASLPAPRRE
ncbi:MAG: xylulokinase [Planctomycetota bacterium]|jgi:xylulokinase